MSLNEDDRNLIYLMAEVTIRSGLPDGRPLAAIRAARQITPLLQKIEEAELKARTTPQPEPPTP